MISVQKFKSLTVKRVRGKKCSKLLQNSPLFAGVKLEFCKYNLIAMTNPYSSNDSLYFPFKTSMNSCSVTSSNLLISLFKS